MACSDPEFFVFNTISPPASYTLETNGPDGEFTVDARFRDGNTGKSTKLKDPQPLDPADGETHVVTVIVFFVAKSTVTVKASCAGQKYCREVSGKANTQVVIVHSLPMAKDK